MARMIQNRSNWDEKDLLLLEKLKDEPQASPERLARLTHIPLSTVRKRLRNLRETKAFEVRAVFPTKAVISIDVDQRAMAHEGEHYGSQEEFALYVESSLINDMKEKHPEFTNVHVEQVDVLLGGRCDIIAIVEASDPRSLCDFVTKGLAIQTGVKGTNTAVVSSPTAVEIRKIKTSGTEMRKKKD